MHQLDVHLIAFSQNVVSVLAVGQIGLGDHLVDLVGVNVLVTDLDELGIDSTTRGLRTIEGE